MHPSPSLNKVQHQHHVDHTVRGSRGHAMLLREVFGGYTSVRGQAIQVRSSMNPVQHQHAEEHTT